MCFNRNSLQTKEELNPDYARATLTVAFVFDVVWPGVQKTMRPLELKPGRTEIKIIECSGLALELDSAEVKQHNCPNVFVTVVIDRKTREVSTYEHRKAGTSPVWNASFVCDTFDSERDALVLTGVYVCLSLLAVVTTFQCTPCVTGRQRSTDHQHLSAAHV
jgi:hypothetical protein